MLDTAKAMFLVATFGALIGCEISAQKDKPLDADATFERFRRGVRWVEWVYDHLPMGAPKDAGGRRPLHLDRGGSEELRRLPAGGGDEVVACRVPDGLRLESARSLAIIRFRWARSIPDILEACDWLPPV